MKGNDLALLQIPRLPLFGPWCSSVERRHLLDTSLPSSPALMRSASDRFGDVADFSVRRAHHENISDRVPLVVGLGTSPRAKLRLQFVRAPPEANLPDRADLLQLCQNHVLGSAAVPEWLPDSPEQSGADLS